MSAILGNTGDRLELDVAADADDADAIRTLEVVAHVEFVEVEGDAELGIAV